MFSKYPHVVSDMPEERRQPRSSPNADSTSIYISQMMCLMHAVDGEMENYAIEKRIRKLFECARRYPGDCKKRKMCVTQANASIVPHSNLPALPHGIHLVI